MNDEEVTAIADQDNLGASVGPGASSPTPPPLSDPTVAKIGLVRRLAAHGEITIIVSLIAAMAIFTLLGSSFVSRANLEAILKAMSFIGIIAVGQTIVLISGEFDLSVGSNAGLSAVVAAWLMTTGGLPVWMSLVAGLFVGAGIGLLNGLVVVKIGIPAFITTIGTLYIARGATYLVSGGYPIYPLPDSVSRIGDWELWGFFSLSFVLLIAVAVAGEVVLRRTTAGRALFASGGNVEVARLAGINTGRVKITAFVVVGLLSALAGQLIMTTVATASSDLGRGYELSVIAGVVVGGVSLFGGVGTIIGACAGILLLQIVQSGLVVVGLDPQWQTIAVGLIMITAVGLDLVRRRSNVG